MCTINKKKVKWTIDNNFISRIKKSLINTQENLVIESAHPSPFSADKGFFGSKPFSRTNDYLIDKGKRPINWKLV